MGKILDYLIIIGVAAGIYLANNMGANDIGNSMGTAVGSGVVKMRQGLIIGAVFMFIGAVFLSGNIIKTISGGIIDTSFITPVGAVVITLSAGLWITVSILRKTPVAGSQSMVGAIFGYGIVYAGITNINWNLIIIIGLSWLLSPILGFLLGFIFYYFLRVELLEKARSMAVRSRIEKIFSYFQIGSSIFTALGIGIIDIAVAAGIMISVAGSSLNVDIKLLGAVGIVSGILIAGNRVVGAVGKRITNLVPTRGVSAQVTAASVILSFAFIGMPVAPTQIIVGSLIGVSLARKTRDIGGDAIRQIISSWFFTFPVSALISGALYLFVSLFL